MEEKIESLLKLEIKIDNNYKLLEYEFKFNIRKIEIILKDINERLNILEDKIK